MHELKENTKTSIKTEIALMLLGPYASYLVATGLNLSGICAILMNGVFLSSFGTPNLQPASKKIIKMIYEVLAYSKTRSSKFFGHDSSKLNHRASDSSSSC